jgi:hypothetical protein
LHRFLHSLNLCRSLMPEKNSSLSNTNSCWPADLPQIWRPLLTTGEASLCQNELICLTNGLLCTDGIGPSSLCVFFTPDSVYRVKKCKNEGKCYLIAQIIQCLHSLNLCRSLMTRKSSSLSNISSCWPADQP